MSRRRHDPDSATCVACAEARELRWHRDNGGYTAEPVYGRSGHVYVATIAPQGSRWVLYLPGIGWTDYATVAEAKAVAQTTLGDRAGGVGGPLP